VKHVPALDGIRALAVLLVMAFHAIAPHTGGGYLGVDVFFVLSGFLITSILLQEIGATGSINVRRFYLRRILRLMPALVLMLLTYLIAAPFLWPKVPYSQDLKEVLLAFFYLSDYANAFWSVPTRLRHTWSLSVEEHFYLIWPIVLLALVKLASRRRMAIALVAMYLLFTGWRIFCDLDGAMGYSQSYYRFDTRLSGLTIGALLALLLSENKATHSRRADLMALGALSVIAFCTLHFNVASTGAMTAGMTAVEISTLILIYTAMTSRRSIVSIALANPTMGYLGRMSYGIYLWHYPIFFWLWGKWPWYMILTIGGSISLLFATLSYYSFERIARTFWQRYSAKASLLAPVTPTMPAAEKH
jgi:peptidoglycan/LPS O-acetylase OafA/YrhL